MQDVTRLPTVDRPHPSDLRSVRGYRTLPLGIAQMGQTKRLGRLPMLDNITPDTLQIAFAESFDLSELGGNL